MGHPMISKKKTKYALIMAVILIVCSCAVGKQQFAKKRIPFCLDYPNNRSNFLLSVYYKGNGSIIFAINQEKQLYCNNDDTIVAKEVADKTFSNFTLSIQPIIPTDKNSKQNCTPFLINKFNQRLAKSKFANSEYPIFLKVLRIYEKDIDNSQYLKCAENKNIWFFDELLNYVFQKDNKIIELLKNKFPFTQYKIKVLNTNTRTVFFDYNLKFFKDYYYLTIPSKIEALLDTDKNVQFRICEKTEIEECTLINNYRTGKYYKKFKFFSNYIEKLDQPEIRTKKTFDIFINGELIKEDAVPSSGNIILVEKDFEKVLDWEIGLPKKEPDSILNNVPVKLIKEKAIPSFVKTPLTKKDFEKVLTHRVESPQKGSDNLLNNFPANESSKRIALPAEKFHRQCKELLPITIETKTLYYSTFDEILLYSSKSECTNNKAPKYRSFFTKAYIKNLRANQNYWAKISGRKQSSGCSKAFKRNNLIVYKLELINKINNVNDKIEKVNYDSVQKNN